MTGRSIALAAVLFASCDCARPPERAPVTAACSQPVAAFFAERRPAYEAALARARAWLDALVVDPTELRAHGIKGKKKLVEQLDAYYRLLRIAPAVERPRLMARIREVVAVTYEDRYHDLLTVDDKTFKQDATSYLRAAVLMERLGLDTRRYREEIRRAHPRLDGHMRTRGVHQRMAFHWYYRHFGLKEPFPLGDAVENGLIERRADPAKLTWGQIYDLTHEVFVPYEYGERLDVDPFSAADKAYLRGALAHLVRARIEQRDADLVAELVSCLRYLRLVDEPAYLEGLDYLLRSQNADGSWGRYVRERRRLGEYVRHGFLLHTTTVAIDALSVAFHEPWNRHLVPPCP